MESKISNVCNANMEGLQENVEIHVKDVAYINIDENMEVLSEHCLTTNPVLKKSSTDGVIPEKMDINDIKTEKVYECGDCFKKFKTENRLKLHGKHHHTSKNGIRCNFCQKIFKYPCYLRSHLKINHLPLTIIYDHNECDICKKIFPHTYELKNHIKADHITIKLAVGSTERTYECDACREIFDKYDLEPHIHIHLHSNAINNSEAKYLKCCICNEMFQTILDLKSHYKLHKNDMQSERPHKCDICFYTFSTLESLNTHRRSHNGEELYSCDYCDALFIHLNCWKIHHIKYHKKETTAIAEDVKSGTNSVDAITITFDCDICQETFPEKQLMICHKRIHEEVRWFKCNICINTFDQSDDLKFHLKKCHVNEHILVGLDKILYECDNCKETFKNDNDLDTHLNIYMNKVSDNSQMSALLQPTQNLAFQESDNSLPVIQNNLNVENSEFQSTSALVIRTAIDVNLFLQPSENSMEIMQTNLKLEDKCTQAQSNQDNYLKAECSQSTVIFEQQKTAAKKKMKRLGAIPHYQCGTCGEIFSRMKHLTAHLQTVNHKSGTKIYQCSICQMICRTLETLEKHKKVKHRAKQLKYECDICRKACGSMGTYRSMDELLKHREQYHNIICPLYQCNICPKIYKSKNLLLTHVRKCHKPIFHKCDKCKKTYKSYELLLQHKKVHTATYECKMCKAKFIGDLNLNHHLLQKHVKYISMKRSYECNICKNTLKEKSDVKTHVDVHLNTNFKKLVVKQKFICYICQKIFDKKQLIIDHMKCHAGFKEYECGICKKEYKYTHELNEHLKEKHVIKNDPISLDDNGSYECVNCKKTFRSSRNLAVHLKTYIRRKILKIDFSQAGQYKCNLCNQTFISKNALGYHMEIHNLQKIVKDIF